MEKRKSRRVIKRLEVAFNTAVENTAITSDLSESGIFIRTNRGVMPGNILNMKLILPKLREFFLTGKVVRSLKSAPGLVGHSKSGMGIQLISPSNDYKDYIRVLLP